MAKTTKTLYKSSVKAAVMKKLKTKVQNNLKAKKSDLIKIKQQRDAKKDEENKMKERLIAKVEDRPAIWDLSNRDHSNKMVVTRAWGEISLALELPVEKLKVMWKLLADRAHGIFREKGHSGDGFDGYKEGEKPWRFYRSLLFLRKSFRFRETQTNYENDDNALFSHECEVTENNENDNPETEENDSMVPAAAASQGIPMVTSTFAKSVPAKIQNGKKRESTQMMGEILKTQLESISHVLTKPSEQVIAPKFAVYLGEFLESIPLEKKKRCELTLLSVAKAYDDENDDFVRKLEFDIRNY